jgi:hypothetical protein
VKLFTETFDELHEDQPNKETVMQVLSQAVKDNELKQIIFTFNEDEVQVKMNFWMQD